jgi:hypothetical protein
LIPSTLTSPTLGELYFNQGFTDKAIEVYRDLSAREPENERVSARLKELEKLQRSLAGGEAPPAAAFAPIPPSIPVTPPPLAAPVPPPAPATFTRPAPLPPPPAPPPPAPTPAAPPPPAPPASEASKAELLAETTAFAAPEALASPVEAPATRAPAPADSPAAERREAIERTIARLEGLLSAIRKG